MPKKLSAVLIFGMFLIGQFARAVEIPNPIQARTFGDLVLAISKAVQQIGGIIAVVAIIFVGFRFIFAAASGNATKLTEARKTFIWVLIGTAIIVGASVLAQVAVNIVKNLSP